MHDSLFSRLAQWTGMQLGKAYAFAAACCLIMVWAAAGPVFHYSDTWQLVINPGTTIVTFLMVFLPQHTQNRDTRVIQLKLDELIRANASARNTLLGLEDLTEKEMARLKAAFDLLARSGEVPAELKQAKQGLDQAQENVAQAQAHVALAAEITSHTTPREKRETHTGLLNMVWSQMVHGTNPAEAAHRGPSFGSIKTAIVSS